MTDRIEKRVVLRAPLARVWSAISDSQKFGAWFGMSFEGPFAAGATVLGRLGKTTEDAELAAAQEPYVGMTFELVIDRIEPMRLFSFRWHPYAVDKGVDYSKEPMTLVIFELAEEAGGTLLVVTESGFDRIPLERRARAFAANKEGWDIQAQLITKYVERT